MLLSWVCHVRPAVAHLSPWPLRSGREKWTSTRSQPLRECHETGTDRNHGPSQRVHTYAPETKTTSCLHRPLWVSEHLSQAPAVSTDRRHHAGGRCLVHTPSDQTCQTGDVVDVVALLLPIEQRHSKANTGLCLQKVGRGGLETKNPPTLWDQKACGSFASHCGVCESRSPALTPPPGRPWQTPPNGGWMGRRAGSLTSQRGRLGASQATVETGGQRRSAEWAEAEPFEGARRPHNLFRTRGAVMQRFNTSDAFSLMSE
jgi:hypothetical protein